MRRILFIVVVIGTMPLMAAAFVVGTVWVLVMAAPTLVGVALIFYFINRSRARRATLEAQIDHDRLLQDDYNRRELQAWQKAARERE